MSQYQPNQPPPGAYPYGPRPTNTMAILAIIFAFVFTPLGIIFGFIARSQIKQTGEGGGGLALAGIIIGFVGMAIAIIAIIAAASAAVSVGY